MSSDIYDIFQKQLDTRGAIPLIQADRLFLDYTPTGPTIAAAYSTALIVPVAAYLEEVIVSYGTPSTSGTVMIEKITGTTVNGSGVNLLQAVQSLSAPGNVRYYPTLVTDTAARTFARGDCIGFVDAGTLTNLTGLSIRFRLRRLGAAFSGV